MHQHIAFSLCYVLLDLLTSETGGTIVSTRHSSLTHAKLFMALMIAMCAAPSVLVKAWEMW